MERVNGEATAATAAAGTAAGAVPQYQPPAVAWEEDFRPLADSLCPPNSGCGDGARKPWEDS